METLRFITAFTRAHYLSLSWVISIRCTPSQMFSSRSILISNRLRLDLPSGLFLSGYNENLYEPILSPIHTTCHMPPQKHLMKSTKHEASPLSCYPVPLSPNIFFSTLFLNTLNVCSYNPQSALKHYNSFYWTQEKKHLSILNPSVILHTKFHMRISRRVKFLQTQFDAFHSPAVSMTNCSWQGNSILCFL